MGFILRLAAGYRRDLRSAAVCLSSFSVLLLDDLVSFSRAEEPEHRARRRTEGLPRSGCETVLLRGSLPIGWGASHHCLRNGNAPEFPLSARIYEVAQLVHVEVVRETVGLEF